MKLTVKTLKGSKFDIDVEVSQTVAQVKEIIESKNADHPAALSKLIHSGKILSDTDVISSCGVKENDCLVVMASKPKKVQTAIEPAKAAPAVSTPSAGDSEKKQITAETTPASIATTPATPSAPTHATADAVTDDAVTSLMSMGFPETEVRHCLRAANGNPDVAVEFLTNGIPDSVTEAATSAAAQTPAASSSFGSGTPLQALRNHPQFIALRRLVQSNPAMLQQVLTQIGQQQPELLQEINSNQALFLQMMNEPVTDVGTSSSDGTVNRNQASSASGSTLPGSLPEAGSPAQMAQLISNMPPEELNQMAAMMGITVEQLRQTAQRIGELPQDELNRAFMQSMGGAEGSGGQHVLHLTQEEMDAVDRLTEMGFDRNEAAQAFIACDKNEALAANFLMDSMGDGGGFGGGFGGDGNDNDDDDDDMYE